MIKTYPQLTMSVGDHSQGGRGVRLINAAYEAKGVPMRHIEVIASSIEEAVLLARTVSASGFGVTMPFKQSVLPHLDEQSDEVSAIGASNCVVAQDGRLVGHNTDAYGAVSALQEVVDLRQMRRALVVGAGGVGRSVAYALKREGLEVFVSARRTEQAQQLQQSLGLAGAIALDEQGAVEADVLVNATPVATQECALRLSESPGASAPVDVVVTALNTPLTQQASARGLAVAKGWRMLLHLGTKHVALWSGAEAPFLVMEDALRQALPVGAE